MYIIDTNRVFHSYPAFFVVDYCGRLYMYCSNVYADMKHQGFPWPKKSCFPMAQGLGEGCVRFCVYVCCERVRVRVRVCAFCEYVWYVWHVWGGVCESKYMVKNSRTVVPGPDEATSMCNKTVLGEPSQISHEAAQQVMCILLCRVVAVSRSCVAVMVFT